MWVKINRGSSSFLLTNRRKEIVKMKVQVMGLLTPRL